MFKIDFSVATLLRNDRAGVVDMGSLGWALCAHPKLPKQYANLVISTEGRNLFRIVIIL